MTAKKLRRNPLKGNKFECLYSFVSVVTLSALFSPFGHKMVTRQMSAHLARGDKGRHTRLIGFTES